MKKKKVRACSPVNKPSWMREKRKNEEVKKDREKEAMGKIDESLYDMYSFWR